MYTIETEACVSRKILQNKSHLLFAKHGYYTENP